MSDSPTPLPAPADGLASLGSPSAAHAEAFATMLQLGAPPTDAIRYFVEAEDWTPQALQALAERWLRDKQVRQHRKRLMGKGFEEMSPEERIKYALDKHYSEMAYFLHSHNYSTLEGASKVKADTARQVLEAKLAGLAGQLDPLSRFWEDFRKQMVAGKGGASGSAPAPSLVPTLPA